MSESLPPKCDHCGRFMSPDAMHVHQPPTEPWKLEPEDPVYLCTRCHQSCSDSAVGEPY